jgi:hypothetical protein
MRISGHVVSGECLYPKKDNDWKGLGLNANRLSDSLENLNRFTLLGKGSSQYMTLLLSLGSLALSLYALWECIRTRVGPRWLWVSFFLTGVGALVVNWSTGQMGLQICALHAVRCSNGHALWSMDYWCFLSVGFADFPERAMERKNIGRAICLNPTATSEQLWTNCAGNS